MAVVRENPRPMRRDGWQAGNSPSRSARIPDDVWQVAKARATHEDHVTMGTVIFSLVKSYAERAVDLPPRS